MVEIQCTSCHTRYRIDERVLPDETPTFKCSRCGHVFSIEPRSAKPAEPKAPASGNESRPRRNTGKTAESRARPSLKIVPPPSPSRESRTKDVATPPPEPHPEPKPADPALEPPRLAESIQQAPRDEPAQPDPQSRPAQPTPQAKPAQRSPADNPIAPKPEAPTQAEPAGPADANPLARSFAERVEDPEPGDSRSFDFAAETEEHADPPPEHEPDDDRWEVGDSHMDFATGSEYHIGAESHQAKPGAAFERREPRRRYDRDEDEARVAMLSLGREVHSAGYFLAWFFFVALGFGALSLLIAGQPAASATFLSTLPGVGDRFTNPVAAAVRVSVRGVRAEYQKINGQRDALVITGEAVNVSNQPLHEIQIAASLLDGAQQQLAKQAVYCGNNLSGRVITQMTPRELDFYQKLGPPKTFVLPPSGSYGFAIVFVSPPPARANWLSKWSASSRPVLPARMTAPRAPACRPYSFSFATSSAYSSLSIRSSSSEASVTFTLMSQPSP